jgi:hypothetical protein
MSLSMDPRVIAMRLGLIADIHADRARLSV